MVTVSIESIYLLSIISFIAGVLISKLIKSEQMEEESVLCDGGEPGA